MQLTLGAFKLENHDPVIDQYVDVDQLLQRVSDNDDGDVQWVTWNGVLICPSPRHDTPCTLPCAGCEADCRDE